MEKSPELLSEFGILFLRDIHQVQNYKKDGE